MKCHHRQAVWNDTARRHSRRRRRTGRASHPEHRDISVPHPHCIQHHRRTDYITFCTTVYGLHTTVVESIRLACSTKS